MSIYKGEDMIAGPTQQKFVRKPAWSRAASVTVAQLNAGYTAPADGILVGYVYTTQQATPTKVMVNGVAISIVYGSASDVSAGSFQIQINQGDSVTVERSVIASNVDISFVPFEDSVIGDPITITPEYIRNQNISSDFESVTPGTTEGTALTFPYDGYGYVRWSSNTTRQFHIKRGLETIDFGTSTAPQFGETIGFTFKKGDKLYSDTGYAWFKVSYYKLRDYGV